MTTAIDTAMRLFNTPGTAFFATDLPPVQREDLADRDFVAELLDCARSMHAAGEPGTAEMVDALRGILGATRAP